MGLNVIVASSEVVPFAKTGGLADVAGSLPHALKKLGCEVSVFMPLYREVLEKNLEIEPTGVEVAIPLGKRTLTGEVFKGSTDGIPVYFIKKDEYFDRSSLYGTPEGDYFDNLERFTFFSRGLLEAVKADGLGIKPDIIHANDWQTGLIPAYIKDIYRHSFPDTRTVFTVHNIAYQGLFPYFLFHFTGLTGGFFSMKGIEFWGKVNLLKAGMVFADIVTTVSEGYSKEIQTSEYGYGLEGVLRSRAKDLYGVLNGVDYTEWNPETDEFLPANYSSDDLKGKAACKKELVKEFSLKLRQNVPLVGVISRLANQKGFDILSEAMEELMELDIGMVVLGTGDKKYHELFTELAGRHPERLGVKITFDNALAHRIEAGCDMFLMPSKYEPCGLNQIYSLRYGTIPVVRATGGLDDTIRDHKGGVGNGFKFNEYSPHALVEKLKEAVKVYKDKKEWKALQTKAMKEDFSWERSARRYLELYELALGKAPAYKVEPSR
jgi:starch synthase